MVSLFANFMSIRLIWQPLEKYVQRTLCRDQDYSICEACVPLHLFMTALAVEYLLNYLLQIKFLVSLSGLMETPRLQAKKGFAKSQKNEHHKKYVQ